MPPAPLGEGGDEDQEEGTQDNFGHLVSGKGMPEINIQAWKKVKTPETTSPALAVGEGEIQTE